MDFIRNEGRVIELGGDKISEINYLNFGQFAGQEHSRQGSHAFSQNPAMNSPFI